MPDKRPRGRPKSEKPVKRPVAIKLDPEFHDRLQAAARNAGTSVNAIIEEGAAIVLKRLEKRQGESAKA